MNLAKEQPYLTEEEIAERLRGFEASKVGLMGTRCRVSSGGRTMAGVTVTFVPEKFMGEGFKSGSGVTDEDGVAEITVEGEKVSGVSLGFYRVEASLKDPSGKETLPARFNTDTKIGQEVQNKRPDVLHIRLDE